MNVDYFCKYFEQLSIQTSAQQYLQFTLFGKLHVHLYLISTGILDQYKTFHK